MVHQLAITSHYSLLQASNIPTMNTPGKETYPLLLDTTTDMKNSHDFVQVFKKVIVHFELKKWKQHLEARGFILLQP